MGFICGQISIYLKFRVFEGPTYHDAFNARLDTRRKCFCSGCYAVSAHNNIPIIQARTWQIRLTLRVSAYSGADSIDGDLGIQGRK
jgi:hypothetical protein